jgi:hypothetical protein
MNERTKREQAQYNDEELRRRAKTFSAKFGHANGQGYNSDYFMRYVRSITKKAKNKEVLELGATGWTWMPINLPLPTTVWILSTVAEYCTTWTLLKTPYNRLMKAAFSIDLSLENTPLDGFGDGTGRCISWAGSASVA